MSDEEVILKAEEKLYNSELNKNEKSELLPALAVYAGLQSKELGIRLFQRRRDIMMEFYTYEIFREDAYKSVGEVCREEGRQEGLEEGLRGGLQEAVQLALEIKFGEKGLSLIPCIKAIDSLEKLEEIKSVVRTAENLDQVESVI